MLDLAAIPTLTTERLLLRRPRDEDFEALLELFSDPEVARFLGGAPPEREQCWRMLAFLLGHWALRGYGLFLVEERGSGALVGRVGLLHPEGYPGVELAWTIGRPFWGKGYASEAARAARVWAGSLGLPPLISLIAPENRRSIRVAEKLGARIERRIERSGEPLDIWRHAPVRARSADDAGLAQAR